MLNKWLTQYINMSFNFNNSDLTFRQKKTQSSKFCQKSVDQSLMTVNTSLLHVSRSAMLQHHLFIYFWLATY